MTRSTSARIAGFTYLVYIAVGVSNEILMGRATSADGTAATFARIAERAIDVRASVVLTLLESFSALVLAVTLYGITRIQDHELAMLALICRVAEGVIGSLGVPHRSGLLWLAGLRVGTGAPDVAATQALGAYLLMPNGPLGAVFFAVGSTIFSYLLLRGRMVPAWLAGSGVVSSALLVVVLPLQLAGYLTGPLVGYSWLPAIAYALLLGPWLLVKGVAAAAEPREPATH